MVWQEEVFDGQEEGIRAAHAAHAQSRVQGARGFGRFAGRPDAGRTVPTVQLHPNQISEWKKQLLERAAEVFDGSGSAEQVNLVPLHAKIGQLALENDFFESALTKAGLLSAKP